MRGSSDQLVVVESKNNHGVLPPPGFESQIIAFYQQVVRGTSIASLGSVFYILAWGKHLFALLIIKNMLLISELLV